MACLNMKETQGGFMGPRISFSNDSNHHDHEIYTYSEAPVSSDFEFSLASADEALFKAGKLPPLKEKVVTLRDELLSGDEDDNKKLTAGWWRDKFGFRKSQNGKSEHKNLGGLETIDEAKIKPSYF